VLAPVACPTIRLWLVWRGSDSLGEFVEYIKIKLLQAAQKVTKWLLALLVFSALFAIAGQAHVNLSYADWNNGAWFLYSSSTPITFIPTHTWYSQGSMQVWSATGTTLGYTYGVSGGVNPLCYSATGNAQPPFVSNACYNPLILPTSTGAVYVSYVVNATTSCQNLASTSTLSWWEIDCESSQSQLTQLPAYFTPPSPYSLHFDYPVSGTTTPPFSHWLLGIDNATTTDQYRVDVHWTRVSHDCGPGIYGSYTYCTIYNDSSQLFYGSTSSTITLPILRPDRNLFYPYDKNISDEWKATAYLSDITQGGSFIASTTVQWTLLRYYADYGGAIGAVGTTTYNRITIATSGVPVIIEGVNNFTTPVTGGVPLRNASTTSGCTPAADWTDIGGGLSFALCTAADQLFTPGTAYTADIQQSLTDLQGDFPFNYVYGTLGSFANSAAAAQSATSSLTLSLWSMNIPILGPNTLSDFVGSSSKDMIFKAEDATAWVGVAWTAVRLIF